MLITKSKSFYYNDVNLLASKPTIVHSRSEVSIDRSKIIISPMASIVGGKFAQVATDNDLTVCLHRFCTPEKQVEIYNSLNNKSNVFLSVGLNDIDRIKFLQKEKVTNWLLDIANGTVPQIKNFLLQLKDLTEIDRIMVGNVHHEKTFDWLRELVKETIKPRECLIRVGIAGGSACATSDMTGINRGQITEIDSCAHLTNNRTKLIADGGISKPSFAAKAFAAGATHIMLGGYFASADIAETNLIGDGTYWGGASHKQQELFNVNGVKKPSEGKVYKIQEIKPFQELLDNLIGGLQSAISYCGFSSLEDFIGNGVFEEKANSLPPKNRFE
jgi:IMP dehydrogenase/GMP reductase